MTNLEKYYDKLTDFCGVNKTTEKVIPCVELRCVECIFGTYNGECCLENLVSKSPLIWLNKEYKEPYKITSEELAFCNMVHTGYLWRENNTLFYFKKKPRKSSFGDNYAVDFENTAIMHPHLFPSFNYIAEDVLVSIEDILFNYSIITE